MSDFDIALERILDEDVDVESEKEQDAMQGAESPTYKTPEPSLGDAIALLRESVKLHITENIELGSKSKVDLP